MPSVSKKQARFMAAAAHNPKFAKKAGIKQSVAKEFNKHDAGTGILKKGLGGAIQQAMNSRGVRDAVSRVKSGPFGRAVQGALARVPRPPTPPPKPVDPGELIRKGSAFRGRNAGPMKSPVAEADTTLTETGEGLRKTIGRLATGRMITAKKGGKIQKYKEGGKVANAMSALQQLAKKYREALDMDDTEAAARIKRQMERMKRGSTKEADEEAAAVGEDKAATFAEGGKVSKVKDLWKVVDQAGKIRSVLDDEDKAFRLSDRINGLGRSKTDVAVATEEDLKKWQDSQK